jgi:hypothetical protein
LPLFDFFLPLPFFFLSFPTKLYSQVVF